MDWSEKISHILEEKGWDVSQLCEATGFDYKYVHALKTGKSKNPRTEFITSLVRAVGISPAWILTEEGPVVAAQIPHGAEFEGGESPSRAIGFPGLVAATSGESSLPLAGDDEFEGARLEGARTLEMSGPANGDDRVFVDFYSGQQAGAGPAKDVEVYQPVTPVTILRRFINPWRPEQVKALEAKGDSMTKIGLFDRDIVLFVPDEREGDGVFVISIENRMQVKRLEFDLLGKTLRIISENDRYEPKILARDEEINRVRIEGKVIGWLHRHPY